MYPVIIIDLKNKLEPLGTKEKFWVFDTSKQIKRLFKIGRPNTGENWAEVVACQIAHLLRLPTAEYQFAKFNDKLGTVSDSFIAQDEQLIHGNDLFVEIDNSYPITRFYKVKQYQIGTVFELIQKITTTNDATPNGLHNFIGYLVFDCLIANQDRHHENWGLIESTKGRRLLAPSFDHASGFANKVSEKEATARKTTKDKNYTIKAFCANAKTPFYDKNGNNLSTLDVCRIAKEFNIRAFNYWTDQIANISLQSIVSIFEQVPNQFIKDYQKEFSIEIIKENITRLITLRNQK